MSSLTHDGLPELWTKVTDYRDVMSKAGEIERKRRQQQTVWMWNHIRESILMLFKRHPVICDDIAKYEDLVAKGAIAPGYAADILLHTFVESFRSDADPASKP